MIRMWLVSVADPESITGINATYISDTEITLTWDLPEGEYNAFEVKIYLSYNIIYPQGDGFPSTQHYYSKH
jgi:hypothetical protein